MIEFGETRRGWLGVRIQPVDEDLAESIGLETAAGALVTNVPDGPSKEAGIETGDVILSFDGKDVAGPNELVRTVGQTAVGKAVRVLIFRDGKTKTLMVTLGRREDAERAEAAQGGVPDAEVIPENVELFGLTLMELTDELRGELGLTADMTGLAIVEVDEASEAFAKGLRAGDVITEAGQEPITKASEFETRAQAARDAGRKTVLLLVRREGQPRFVALSVEELSLIHI